MCRNSFHMDGSHQGSPTEQCPNPHMPVLRSCHSSLMCSPRVPDRHAPGHPCAVKEKLINQTRPPYSIAPLSISDAHMPIVGAFCGRQGLELAAEWSAPMQPHTQHTTICCVSRHPFIRTSINFSHLRWSSSSVGSDYAAFAPYMHH